MKIIVTGATGMVGEGVILSCIDNPIIEKIVMVNRKPSILRHSKLEEYILSDFINGNYDATKLSGFDACFFCAGISSIGMSEADYTVITFDTTLAFAHKMKAFNPNIVFHYISGASTDSTEKGKMMWARVKGKTENTLLNLGFRKAFMFRPGYIKHYPGQKNLPLIYKVLYFIIPILTILFPNGGCTVDQIAKAMINTCLHEFDKTVLEVVDIKRAASLS